MKNPYLEVFRKAEVMRKLGAFPTKRDEIQFMIDNLKPFPAARSKFMLLDKAEASGIIDEGSLRGLLQRLVPGSDSSTRFWQFVQQNLDYWLRPKRNTLWANAPYHLPDLCQHLNEAYEEFFQQMKGWSFYQPDEVFSQKAENAARCFCAANQPENV